MDTNLIRYVAMAETGLLMVLAASLAGRFLARRGWVALVFGLLLGARELLLVAAIYTNALSPTPPTPGVKLYAVAVAPIVLGLAVLVRVTSHQDNHPTRKA